MATRRFSIPINGTQEHVLDVVGAATITNPIELTVDQGVAVVTDANVPGGFRAVKKSEVDYALIVLREYVYKSLNLSA